MSTRHYSTTKEFARTVSDEASLGARATQILGLVLAVLSLVLAAAGALVLWWVVAGITVVFVAIYVMVWFATRSQGKTIQAALAAGPIISIDDDTITYSGTPALWSDITEIHVVDLRRDGPLPGMGEFGMVTVDIEFADSIHSIELDEVLPSGIITVMLADLQRTAVGHGIPFGTSRTNREYNAFVKADPRKKR